MSCEFVWYFAIGSMINPISLKAREIVPAESCPAILKDFNIDFFGSAGMATAKRSLGESFHGVAHRITMSELLALDKLESVYDRHLVTLDLYDGRHLEGWVYIKQDIDFATNNPPSERYMSIITSGCEHFGVNVEYINYLKSLKVVPRRKAPEFRAYPLPEGLPTWTIEQVREGSGEEGKPLYFALNGKVLEFVGDETAFPFSIIKNIAREGNGEISMAKNLYDPYYGIPEKLEDFKREHCAAIEDQIYQTAADKLKVIALFTQSYAD
jgi:cation transport regulator ChaC